jgi:hypothetical protein
MKLFLSFVGGLTSSELKLIGRSSSDGTNGLIYTDLEKITTAKSIVKSVKIQIIE